VTISYNREADVLVIHDTAMGMSLQELRNAVLIGKPPAVTTGRSQFGLGLKTAACWFGDKWSVRTKKLGESVGHEIVVDVEKVASGRTKLPNETFDAEPNDHFTEVRIEQLHLKLQGRKLGKTKESLRSMYRVDMRQKKLEIVWDTATLDWRDELRFLDAGDGSPAKRSIDFDVGVRKVTGWVGVLAPGSSKRTNAGFALIRRGRLIRGWPDSWRPEAIFGPPPGTNDLINQRVTGEISLDEFDVTHTKDDILWHENEEDEVQDGIKERIPDLLTLARDYRQPVATEAPRLRKLSLDSVIEESGLAKRVAEAGAALNALLSELAPAEVLETVDSALTDALSGETSLFEFKIGNETVRVMSAFGDGEEKPYLLSHGVSKASWIVAMNATHAMCAHDDEEALRVHVQHTIADGIIIWAAKSGRAEQDPFVLLHLKDAILRIIAGDGNK
jgi:hypothetical protein